MRRSLQVFLVVVGSVAVVAGALAVARGASGVVGEGEFSRNVDSEFRFFAAWYVVAGALLLASVPRVERERRVVFALAGGFFLSACGRVLSMADVGQPDRLYVVLMTIEFVLAVVIPPWHYLVARRSVGEPKG